MKKAVSKIKTKTVLYALCAILCAAPLMMCPPSVEASNDATVKSYKDQLADLQAEQDRLMTEIDSLRSQAAQSAEYKASIDHAIQNRPFEQPPDPAFQSDLDDRGFDHRNRSADVGDDEQIP